MAPRTELGRVVAAYLEAAARYVAARDRLRVPPADLNERALAELAWLEAEQEWAAVRGELDCGFWVMFRVACESDPEALARYLAPVVDTLIAEPVRVRLLKAEERANRLEAELDRMKTDNTDLARALVAMDRRVEELEQAIRDVLPTT